MSASPLSILDPSSRSLEWLAGPEALLSSTTLTTSELASLGPIASPTEGATDAGAAQLSDALTPVANQFIIDTHAQIEGVGHEVAPLNGPLHGLTGLGETIGLGHVGEGGNLLTDVDGLAANPTDTGAIAPLSGDVGYVAEAAGSLLGSVIAAPVAGNGLVGTGGALTPATGLLDQAVLDAHASIEGVGHAVPVLNAPVHALTGLGETVGLGHIGEADHLLTDLTTVPGSLLSGGGLASVSPVLTDLGHVLGSADALIGSVSGVASGGGLLSADGTLAPVTNLANGAVLAFHASLEDVGHQIAPLNDSIHGLTHLGETIGLGHLGEGGNLVTDVAALPGDLLGGHGAAALSPVLGDVGAVANAAGGLLDGAAGLVGGAGTSPSGVLAPVTSVVGGVLDGHAADPLGGTLSGTPATGALLGTGTPLQPVGDIANGVIDGVHANLEQTGHDVPVLNDPLHSTIALGNTAGLGELGGTGNLVTDVANLPVAVLGGHGPEAATGVADDVGHVADAAGGVAGSLTGLLDGGPGAGGFGTGTAIDGVLAPVTGALGGADHGGAANPVGGLLGGLTGGAAGDAAAGTHPLIDVGAGPATPTPVADAAVLTPAGDPGHVVQASAVAVPAGQPALADADLLTGDSIAFPQTGGGADTLVGHLHDVVPTAATAPMDGGGAHGLTLDAGIAAIDLGGHADVHHADPTPHTAPTGAHLLGL